MPRRALPKLPRSLRIGAFDYSVEDWPASLATSAHRYGECDLHNLVIRIRTDVPAVRIVEALLHEVLHAAWNAGECDNRDEEKTVSVLGLMLTQIWRDNPHLVGYVSAMLAR